MTNTSISRRLRLLGAVAAACGALAGSSFAATNAGFTSVNEAADGAGHCANGNPGVNCNIYDEKDHVWMNGGPFGAALDYGTYYFEVYAPGGTVLSTDLYTNRTFQIDSGGLTYGGDHDHEHVSYLIRLMPFADTPNPGGEYHLRICSLAEGYPAPNNLCKSDAFKIQVGQASSTVDVTKTIAAGYTDVWPWTILKAVDKTVVKQIGGSATFNYTISLTSGTRATDVSSISVGGDITATLTGLASLPVTITDSVGDVNATCALTGGASRTLVTGANVYPYTCTYTAAPTADPPANTVTVTWASPDSPVQYTLPFTFTVTEENECVDVTDTYYGTLASNVCVTQAAPVNASYPYSRIIPIPQYGCLSYDNTATWTSTDTADSGSSSKTVQVCGPLYTDAKTIGYWQNKNGQALIKGAGGTPCVLTAELRSYAPFADLGATATCTQVASYVMNVVKAASAAGSTMNAMLKAQMLSTALSVHFSGMGLGGTSIDLTHVGASGQDVSAAFGGAASLTVNECLAYAASQSNSGGTMWYGNVKSMQELAKNLFDAINNLQVFAP